MRTKFCAADFVRLCDFVEIELTQMFVFSGSAVCKSCHGGTIDWTDLKAQVTFNIFTNSLVFFLAQNHVRMSMPVLSL